MKTHNKTLLEQIKAKLEKYGEVYCADTSNDEGARVSTHSEFQTLVSGEAQFISLEEMERRLHTLSL